MLQSHKTQKKSTIGNFTFLFLAYPFGMLYFLTVVIGFSLGLGTLILWIGIPILFATIALVRGFAAMERTMVTNLLRVSLPEQCAHPVEQRSLLKRFGSYLRDPLTWTSVIYMLLKLPIGIISFVLVLTLPIVAASLTLLPAVYLVNLFVNSILLANGIHSASYIIPYFIEVHGTFDPVMFLRSFVAVPVGLVLWFVTRYVLNGLALFSAELARALLCPAETAAPLQPNEAYAYQSAQEARQARDYYQESYS